MTGVFSVSLPLLKFGMLGCEAEDVCLSLLDSWGFLSPVFLSLMGHLVQVGFLKWSHWLVSSHWFFVPQDRLQLRFVVAHYQIVQCGQICYCFCQVAAEFSTAATLAGKLLAREGGAP
jgi:hypothetical protein